MKVTGCEKPSWRIVVVKNGQVGSILTRMEKVSCVVLLSTFSYCVDSLETCRTSTRIWFIIVCINNEKKLKTSALSQVLERTVNPLYTVCPRFVFVTLFILWTAFGFSWYYTNTPPPRLCFLDILTLVDKYVKIEVHFNFSLEAMCSASFSTQLNIYLSVFIKCV